MFILSILGWSMSETCYTWSPKWSLLKLYQYSITGIGSIMAFGISDQTRQRALAWVTFLILRSPSISVSTKINLQITCVTVLLYGFESWVISGNMENKINAFATSCYWIMLNIKWLDCVSNKRIYHIKHATPCQLYKAASTTFPWTLP